ncbi:MAG: DUF2071 domain-containing protein [Acidobacteriota bacterium]|nr:DUF2071 domain-containing protein [Acidobacteriota bacterium]
MNIPTLQGIIKRRILVNYRADADVMQKVLPKGFRPKLYVGQAIAGICLIRLEHIRPKFMPEFVGIASENAAHRIAVLWENENGETREGVYIPRRDTDSFINSAVGGKLFPGEHHRANFKVSEIGNKINFSMKSEDETASVKLAGIVSKNLPENSAFSSLDEASKFFEKGSLGYSVTKDGTNLDGISLEIKHWKVEALDLDFVQSSFYDDETIFPKDSIEFDHALLMQNIAHEWHSAPSFDLT